MRRELQRRLRRRQRRRRARSISSDCRSGCAPRSRSSISRAERGTGSGRIGVERPLGPAYNRGDEVRTFMRRFAMWLLSLAAIVCPAHSQVLYGSIVGTVQDSSGAAMPNAAVSIENTATTLSRAAVSSEDGAYAFADVPAGSYTLTVSAKGFRVSRTTNVQVTINSVARNDVRLQVGELAETVNVEASAAVLQTDTADVHVSLGSRQISDLPLPGYRNYQS